MRACTGVSAPADGSSSPRCVGTAAVEAARAAQHRARRRRCASQQRRFERVVHACRCRCRRRTMPSHAGVPPAPARIAAVGAGVAGDDLDPAARRLASPARARPSASPAGQSRRRAAGLPRPRRAARRRPSRRHRGGRCAPCARRSAECTVPASTAITPRAPGSRATRHRIEQVLRAVAQQRGGRAHRRRQHHRLGRRQHALQQVGGLLQRVGAVGDHDAGHLGARQVVRHARGQRGARSRSSMSLLSSCATCSVSSATLGAAPARRSTSSRHAELRGGVADVVAGVARRCRRSCRRCPARPPCVRRFAFLREAG